MLREIAAVATIALLVLPAKAQNYGGCRSVFEALVKEGARISPILDLVIDPERRQIIYILPDRREQISFPPGDIELLAVQKELRFIGRSWYLILQVDRNRWQPHYARDVGDACEHYTLGPPDSG